MAAPSVYGAITAITAEFAAASIPKAHLNQVDQYLYRSIDDVLNRLSPLLAKHHVCVLPRAIERVVTDRTGLGEALLVNVALRVVYTIVSAEDGSCDEVEAFGEALDAGDKATAKAMSAAYKSAMLQAFCIPVADAEEPDASSPRLSARKHSPAPIQGWEAWTLDIKTVASSCESEEAIGRVQQTHRPLLQALSRERPELYAELGEAFRDRRAELTRPARTEAFSQQVAPRRQQPMPATQQSKACRSRKRQPAGEPELA
jgi:hypothetical protein